MQGLPHLYTEDDFGFSFRGIKSELSETTQSFMSFYWLFHLPQVSKLSQDKQPAQQS
jgi:hypothetical protein